MERVVFVNWKDLYYCKDNGKVYEEKPVSKEYEMIWKGQPWLCKREQKDLYLINNKGIQVEMSDKNCGWFYIEEKE